MRQKLQTAPFALGLLLLVASPAFAAQQNKQQGTVRGPVTTQPSDHPFDSSKNRPVPPAASRRNSSQNGMTNVPLPK